MIVLRNDRPIQHKNEVVSFGALCHRGRHCQYAHLFSAHEPLQYIHDADPVCVWAGIDGTRAALAYNRSMETPFDEYSARVQKHLENVYGIRVVTRDIPDPLSGDLDGSEIHIDYAVTPEQRLFLLGHLFGHTVQWNVDPASFEIGRQFQPPVKEDLIPGIIAYEREAACYGLAMFHQIGITGIDIDQWFCDYTACDQAYLLHFYRTGEKRDFHSFWRINAPLIEPKAVPMFTPIKRSLRMDGVVI